ncbi:MBL fold metallo-hydrolase [Streptomyces sp. H27-D2]|uniref:MBL fold metallo-hydrolase n=1 Tax=Streptomyces sp. H27-D2 TaxID=3046304 RepID=UPI002DB7EBE6|nr:MBL fold metallo-hydrolase [Streptomyces sp. H27-D2]MEC4017761.1 MBL fold metallo-hydrolase [Streptomyces sp. H27-D2]
MTPLKHQVTDHGGGVWSIPVPIPDNPLGHTLVHLLDTDRGPVLIDTGWDDPASWDTLVAGLAACGVAVGEIHGVLITHHHPDHHGLSGRVREASGAWLAMHAADTNVVLRSRESRPGVWLDYLIGKLTLAGAPEDHLAPLRTARDEGRMRTLPHLRAALPDREIVPGELLDLAGRRLRAIWTPGHTPGHVCLHLEERHPGLSHEPGAGGPRASGAAVIGAAHHTGGAHHAGGAHTHGHAGGAHGAIGHTPAGHGRLFSGDHLLPGITPHIGLYEDPDDLTVTDPLGDYLDSLERIGRLGPAEVLPAHQYAFTDAAGRVRELLEHHAARLADLRELLAVRPLTLWRLAESMEWNRPWAQIPYGSRNIALSEAEAHVRRLVKLGLAEPTQDSDPVTYQAV